MKKSLGFTLSEVLITLVIIGIVAAITVPTLMANSNEQALKSALKKNNSVISQALRRYYIDNGENLTVTLNDSTQFQKIKENFILKYFNVAKIVDSDDYLKDIKYRSYDSKEFEATKYCSTNTCVILDDGTSMSVLVPNGNGVILGGFIVDVNGPFKKPNQAGKDTFLLYFYHSDGSTGIQKEGSVIPAWDGSNEANPFYKIFACNRSGGAGGNYAQYNGLGCTAKVLQDKSY